MIKFIKIIHDIDSAIECLPMIIVYLVSLTKYLNWIFNAKKVMVFFNKILEVNQDIEIMENWLERIRSVGSTYTSMDSFSNKNYLISVKDYN